MFQLLLIFASVFASGPNPDPAQFRFQLFQAGTPNTLTLTVTPPAPAAAYTVTCTFGIMNGHTAWYGALPNGAKAPVAASKVYLQPWILFGMDVVVVPTLPNGLIDYSKIGCRIAFMPAAGNADLGGGIIIHNPSPTVSAGPNFISGKPTPKDYSFTVGP